jgi:hypothetical protein
MIARYPVLRKEEGGEGKGRGVISRPLPSVTRGRRVHRGKNHRPFPLLFSAPYARLAGEVRNPYCTPLTKIVDRAAPMKIENMVTMTIKAT